MPRDEQMAELADCVEELRRRLGESVTARLVETFLETSGEAVTRLSRAYWKKERDVLRETANELKGMSALIGAARLSNLCAELERLPRGHARQIAAIAEERARAAARLSHHLGRRHTAA